MPHSPHFIFDVIQDTSLYDLENTFSKFHHVVSITNDFENGKWRIRQFLKFVIDNLTQTALSNEERKKTLGNPFSALTCAIDHLRKAKRKPDGSESDDKGKGGEIAEILIYGIMRCYYKALPVVPKIFYKQNDNDNAKGADSVHITINEEDNTYSLWLGEAKFYNSIDPQRFDNPVQSVLNTLSDISLRKECSIVCSLKDIDGLIKDANTLEQIKIALSPSTSLDKIKSHLHIPILLLHECEKTSAATDFTDEFKEELINWHISCAKKYFEKLKNKNEKLENPIYKFDIIHFHLILFPVPNKEVIIEKFYSYINSINAL